jgi:nicotinamidase-related amidase
VNAGAPGLEPGKTALLVMDFQRGVVARVPDPDALVARVRDAIASVRAHGGTIGYVRVAFTEADWAAVPAANAIFARVAADRLMHDEDPATAIDDQLAPQPGDIEVRKTRVGAMSTTDLDEQLRRRGITTLVLAGISTSGVVLSTVIEAADRDYQLYVLSDGTEDSDAQVRDVLLTKVFPRRAHVIDTAQLSALLEAGLGTR